jgi:hypothetical protein
LTHLRNNILTIQTGVPTSFALQNNLLGPVAVVSYELPSDVATAAGQWLAEQLMADPTTTTGVSLMYFEPITDTWEYNVPIGQPIPAYVLTAISNSADANILELSSVAGFNPSIFVPVDADLSISSLQRLQPVLTWGINLICSTILSSIKPRQSRRRSRCSPPASALWVCLAGGGS